MKPIYLLLAVIFAANFYPALSTPANAQPDQDEDPVVIETSNPGALTMVRGTDSSFLVMAYNTSLFEMAAAKLALQKSQNQKVRDFASEMLADHNVLNANVRSVSAKIKVTLPQKLSEKELQDYLTLLKGLSGNSFDEKYIDINVKRHNECVSMFEEAVNGNINIYSPEVKQLAASNLDKINTHRDTAILLQRQFTFM